ncbi:MAG TPA: hemerythrin domain-containing protein [Opitutaceae bacterium]|nr:hemerythrin domain-containing protein [Opitutaceae bacterium]
MFSSSDRRGFLRSAGWLAAGGLAVAAGCRSGEEEVAPGEDLMREHGVLKRILLVYDELVRRLGAGAEVPPAAVADSAGIIRNFIEDYHERLEENYLFPRFQKAGQLPDLVATLIQQHQAGRRLTDQVQAEASFAALKSESDRQRLKAALQQFIRMYSPHEAREDTVLFPAFRKLVSQHEYDSLGEDFEKEERRKFGEDGFEMMVDKVAAIEKSLGIFDLAQFTPPAP